MPLPCAQDSGIVVLSVWQSYVEKLPNYLPSYLRELSSETGQKLFRRGRASVSLTDEGMLLRKRTMADKAIGEQPFTLPES